MALPGSDFAIAPCEQPKDLPFMLGALVRFNTEHDGRRPPSLCDDERLLSRTNPLESRGRILPEIGDRNDVRHLGHIRPLLEYVQEYLQTSLRTSRRSMVNPRRLAEPFVAVQRRLLDCSKNASRKRSRSAVHEPRTDPALRH